MKFSSEHHNWNMTIMASSRLLTLGENVEKNDYSFSAFAGSMLLAVAGLESFLNSIAHTISINESEFPYFEFERKGIIEKLYFLLDKFGIRLNKGERPCQTVKKAVAWRNSIVHSKPSYVEETIIEPGQDIRQLPKQYMSNENKYLPYENFVSQENADRFNRDIIEVIELIKKTSGLNPRAQCTYKIT
jgi:hypothetical protein